MRKGEQLSGIEEEQGGIDTPLNNQEEPVDSGEGTESKDNPTYVSSVRSSILESKNPLRPNLGDYYDEFDNTFERSEYFEILDNELYDDGDSIKNESFLDRMENLTSYQRIHLIVQAARQSFVSPNDFTEYFARFPEDAFPILDTCLNDYPVADLSDWKRYQLGSKVLESAARSVPGYFDTFVQAAENQEQSQRIESRPSTADFLRIGRASEHARSFLLGEFKKPLRETIIQFGETLADRTCDYIKYTEDTRNGQDWGIVDFSPIIQSKEYMDLDRENKIGFVKATIEYCHNAVIFHEEYDYHFDETHTDPSPEFRRDDPLSKYSGHIYHHSILYQTEHRSPTYELPQYNAFSRNWDEASDYFGYEIIIQQLINEIGRIGSEKDIDFLIHFWDKNRHPAYGPDMAKALSNLGAPRSAELILDSLKKASEPDKRRLLSLLYRLELGMIGVSEAGLEYLGRRFDLGDFNDRSNGAYRITRDGEVGIFDSNHRLSGYVQLESGDFGGTDESIRKQVLNITYDMLFIPRPDETAGERDMRERILDEFKSNYFDTYLSLFSEQTNLRFNDLSFPEQGWVLTFLGRADNEEKRRFFEFVGRYGENGFYAFRSMEFDLLTGGQVLNLDRELGPERTAQLLGEYRETYRLANELANHIATMLQIQDNALEVDIIRQNILATAQGYLINPSFIENSTENKVAITQLGLLNHELRQCLSLQSDIDGFIDGQFILGRFLRDNISGFGRDCDDSLLAPAVISRSLERLYNNPDFNLRDYEGKTTDQSISLEKVLSGIDGSPLGLIAKASGERLTLYDIGAGEGRMAIPLSLLGYDVVGIDISSRMISQIPERIERVNKAIQGNAEDLAVTAINNVATKMRKGAEAQVRPNSVDIRQGNFFEFTGDDFRQSFGERADCAIIMWHTLGFAGSPESMAQVLQNAYESLKPGAVIMIEMPDRNFGGYARAIREYYGNHPDQPFGAIVDAPSRGKSPTENNEAISSSRYFPSDIEIISALEASGFSFERVETYFVRTEDRKGLAIKENLFIASKPMDLATSGKLLESLQQLNK